MTEPDRKAFFEFALASEAQFAALDQQASQIIATAKAQGTADGLIPPPPPELNTLQEQKAALMLQLATSLAESTVSDQGKAAIALFLKRAAANTEASTPANGQ